VEQFSACSFAFRFLVFQCFLTLVWSVVTYVFYKHKMKTVPSYISTDCQHHPRFLPIQSLYLWGMVTGILWFSCGVTLGIDFLKG